MSEENLFVAAKPPASGKKASYIIRSGRALSVFLSSVPDRGARICDLGCGSGAFLKLLRDEGYVNLSGAEINDYDAGDFKVLPCDFSYSRLPCRDGAFDALTAWEVFEHLENPHNLVREAARVLRTGGIFVISMPNPFHIQSRLRFLRKGDFIRWKEKGDHIWVFTNNIFKKIFLRDFELIERNFCVPSWGQKPLKNAKSFRGWIRQRAKVAIDRILPEGEWFGYFVVYVLRRKA